MEKEEIVSLLAVRGERQQELFRRARSIREQHFGDRAVVRGVIEITDRCRVNCSYCPMRRDNLSGGFILSARQIVAAAVAIRQTGIRVVFLQGGEMPETTEVVCEAIPELKRLFAEEIQIVLCLGNKSHAELARLKELGADSYILKHETSDPNLFYTLRHRCLEDRLACLQDLLALGYRVGTGNIVGLPGQSMESIACDILLPAQLGAHMTSCAPFIPARNTPLAGNPTGDINLTLNTLALMRIANPEALIPTVSALEKLRPGGQLAGLNAGANVITVNFTPEFEKSIYRIYGTGRFCVSLGHAASTLEQAGLCSALVSP
jgi:biotin synthase